ncbi:MAG: hypothetical protein KBT69_01850 [Oceanihabitans sp.]|nr:hypothetical protein [Oceanihabitans sp.]
MKTKKYLMAIAIFGGVLFTAQATNLLNIDGTTTTKIEKKRFRVPTGG